MKIPKKKKAKEELEIEGATSAPDEDGRPIPFGALAELTSSDVIAEVKRGMSSIEPLDLDMDMAIDDEELNEDAA